MINYISEAHRAEEEDPTAEEVGTLSQAIHHLSCSHLCPQLVHGEELDAEAPELADESWEIAEEEALEDDEYWNN